MSRTATNQAERDARWRRVHIAGDSAPEFRVASPERPFWRPDAELVADEPDAKVFGTYFPVTLIVLAPAVLAYMLGWL